MQLPFGKIVSSHKGTADLKELGGAAARDSLTGYLRVSVFDKSAVRECVIVYATGRPVMAFASDGTADRKDPDYRQMNEAVRKDNAIVEVCQLQEKQVKLLQDLYRELAIAQAPAAAAQVKPAPKEQPVVAPAPRREEKARLAQAPEIRGRFVRAESVRDVDEYLQRHPAETGHLLYIVQANGRLEEQHIILIKGKIEAAYNERSSGPELLEKLKGVSGHAELYAVDETLLTSIVTRQAGKMSPPAAEIQAQERPALERQTSGIGIPARDLLESSWPPSSSRDDICRAMGEISCAMEDDIAMVRKVEREFASHVDELLCRLELSHLRSRKKM